MRWCAPAYEPAFEDLCRALEAAVWPTPPPGYDLVTLPRPMRLVLRGHLAAGDGARAAAGRTPVYVKWHRPDTLGQRLSGHVRGGRGVREGRVLRGLAAGGVEVPEVLAFSDEGIDVLVTREVAPLTPLPHADEADATTLEQVATLLAKARTLGLAHRDLHAGNLGLAGDRAVLIDLGGARLGAGARGVSPRALGAILHGLLGGTRRTQRLRALRAYLRATACADPAGEARRLATRVEEAATAVRRRYRLGRDRRARRTGKHFEQFTTAQVARGTRFKDEADETLRDLAGPWLAGPPANATPLKAGGRVVRAGAVALKYYEAAAPGRLPRALRAFRVACALQNRGIAVPAPMLAAVGAGGAGVYAATWIDAPDLHTVVAGGGADDALLHRLGRMVRLLHEAEITHRDLKAPNLLVAPDGSLPIADLDGARVRVARISWARRARDLMRLDASLALPAAARARVIEAYHDVLPRPPVTLAAFARRVAALSARKRGPGGEAR